MQTVLWRLSRVLRGEWGGCWQGAPFTGPPMLPSQRQREDSTPNPSSAACSSWAVGEPPFPIRGMKMMMPAWLVRTEYARARAHSRGRMFAGVWLLLGPAGRVETGPCVWGRLQQPLTSPAGGEAQGSHVPFVKQVSQCQCLPRLAVPAVLTKPGTFTFLFHSRGDACTRSLEMSTRNRTLLPGSVRTHSAACP